MGRSKNVRNRPNRVGRRLNLEQLEARRVFAGMVFDYVVPISSDPGLASVSSVTTDAQGNSIITGSYRGTVDFDPANVYVDNADFLTSRGERSNIFVAKYFATGELDWARGMGSEMYGGFGSDSGSDVITDSDGNAYVTGTFLGQAQFGATTLTSNGGGDGFLMKLDATGAVLWASSWGTAGAETGTRLAFAKDGNILLTSSAPGGVIPLKSFEDATGVEQWQVNLAGGAFGVGARIAVDSSGAIYIANGFGGTLDVDLGVGTHNISHSVGFSGTHSTYLLKLSETADFVWARVFETYPSSPVGISYPSDLVVDVGDNIFLAGIFRNQVDFNPSPDAYYQLPPNPDSTQGGYLTRFDTAGNLQWASATGSADQIVVDSGGSIYAVGRNVQKFGPDGNELWANETIDVDSIAEGDTFSVGGAALGTDDRLVVAGKFQGTVDFNSGAADATTASAVPSGYLLTLLPGQGTTPVKVDLFSDSFESGQWNGLWVQDSQNDWFVSQQRRTSGNYSAEVDGPANNATLTTANTINLSGMQSATLTFDWLIESGFDTGEYLSLDISTNSGATWIQDVRRLNGNVSVEDVWHTETVDLTPYQSSQLKIRYRATASAADEDANVDNVRIVGVLGMPNVAPLADAGGSYAMNEGASVTLSAAASSDPDGSIVSYAWDFDGDGAYNDASGISPIYSTTASGTQVIGLLITDNRGATATTNTTVVVNNVAPTANAGNDLTGTTDQSIALSASASSDPGQDIVSYQWDLNNDGIYDDAMGISAVFTSATTGVFTVGLKVTDADGVVGFDSLTITVTPAPLLSTKFYVVDDASSNRTFEYGGDGSSVENYALNSGNSTPRGAASTAAGDKVWVVDANKKVYVYSDSGVLLGSWTAGSLTSKATIEGITTDGTDVWLVDARQDRVYRYAGAASRLSGSQNAASNFALNSSNVSPKDLVTDGTNMWVVNDSTTDKIFKYTMTGALVGSWTISSVNSKPTGLTIDPSGASQSIWIVDNGTDRVYEYTDARSRNSGSQSAAVYFALSAGNSNPQGIADPPASVIGKTNVAQAQTSAPLNDWIFPELSSQPSSVPVIDGRGVTAVQSAPSSSAWISALREGAMLLESNTRLSTALSSAAGNGTSIESLGTGSRLLGLPDGLIGSKRLSTSTGWSDELRWDSTELKAVDSVFADVDLLADIVGV